MGATMKHCRVKNPDVSRYECKYVGSANCGKTPCTNQQQKINGTKK